MKDIRSLAIKHQRAVWGDSDDDYDEKPKKNFLRKSYSIIYEDTKYAGRRVILGQDVKIETIKKLKFLQKMVSYCQKKLKLNKLKTIGLLRYITNVKKLKLSIKNPEATFFSKVSFRSEAFRSLKSLDFQFELDYSSKRGGWKAKKNMPLQRVLESISKSKSLTSASFVFKFVRFANPDVLKNVGLWLDKTRERNFYISVELEVIDDFLSIVPLIEFRSILKHCDLLRLFIRNARESNEYEEYDDNNPLEEVPWIGPGDSIESFEEKRRIELTIFKDNNAPEKRKREDFREILACCENLKSLIFYTGVNLFKWGNNEEYKTEEESKFSIKKDSKEKDEEEENEEEENEEDYEDVDEDEEEDECEENDEDDDYDEENEDEGEEEEKKVDEEVPKLSKIEAEEKAVKCLQGLEEIVIACATVVKDDGKADTLMDFFKYMKRESIITANTAFPEHMLQKKSVDTKRLPEFLTHFLGKINENSRSLKYLRLCHCYFDLDRASIKCKEDQGTQDQQDFITTNLLIDKDWNFESVETIELFPGKNDDYDKLKSMLVQMKNLTELIINLKPFYRDQKITFEEIEEHLKEIRKALPNLNIKITDEI